MATHRHSLVATLGATIATAVLLAPVGAADAAPRHVICDTPTKTIRVDYDGGCLLTFSTAIKRLAYTSFSMPAALETQWAGSNIQGAVASMKCSRGGTIGLLHLDKWQAGTCEWNETWGHRGLGEHPDHTWECRVTMVVTSAPSGRPVMKKGRAYLPWKVSATPLDDGTRMGGEYPSCDRDADDNFGVS